MFLNDDDFDKAIQDQLDQNKAKLLGTYGQQLMALQKISPAQLNALIPDMTDTDTFNQLIAVVTLASQDNTSQAELASQIRALGQNAVKIAGMVGLAV